MANVFTPGIQEDKDKNPQDAPQIVSSGEGITPSQPQQTSRQGSGAATGGFSNLRKYMDANKGAGQQLSGQIQQQVSGAADQAKEKLTGAQTVLRDQATAERDRLAQASNLKTQLGQQGGAEAISENQPQMQQFQQLLSGKGADISSGLQKTQGDIQKAQNLAKMTETEGGRFGLLRQQFQRPGQDYTAGQQRLDQLLLQSQGGAGDLVKSAREQAGNIEKLYGDISSEEAATRTDLGNIAPAAKSDLSKALEGQITGFSTDLGDRLTTQQEQINANLARLKSGELSVSDLQQFGLLGEGKMGEQAPPSRTYGMTAADLQKFIQAPETYGITKEQIAGQEDINRARALERLQGLTEGSLVGQQKELGNIVTYNKEGLMGELAKRQSEYQEKLNPITQREELANRQQADLLQAARDAGMLGTDAEIISNISGHRAGGQVDSAKRDAAWSQLYKKYGFADNRNLLNAINQGRFDASQSRNALETQYSGTARDILGGYSK